jgi:hypothetical protein
MKMKKTILMIIMAALAAGVSHAADVSVGADVASAYVFRGATFNDGLVVQPYAEIGGIPIPEEYGSLAFGVWANYDISDYGGTLEKNQFSEVDFYLSYALPISLLDVSVGYTEYTYPSGGGDADREIGLSLGKAIGETGLAPYVNVYYGVDGGIDGVSYLQGGLSYELALTDSLGLSADISAAYSAGGAADGMNDATGSLGASYSLADNLSLSASVTYVAELDSDVLETDTQVYGMVGIGYDF